MKVIPKHLHSMMFLQLIAPQPRLIQTETRFPNCSQVNATKSPVLHIATSMAYSRHKSHNTYRLVPFNSCFLRLCLLAYMNSWTSYSSRILFFQNLLKLIKPPFSPLVTLSHCDTRHAFNDYNMLFINSASPFYFFLLLYKVIFLYCIRNTRSLLKI